MRDHAMFMQKYDKNCDITRKIMYSLKPNLTQIRFLPKFRYFFNRDFFVRNRDFLDENRDFSE